MFDFSNYSSKSKYYDPNPLVVGQIKDEMDSIVIEGFDTLKSKMYLILLCDSSKYKKAKGANKNVVAKKVHIF